MQRISAALKDGVTIVTVSRRLAHLVENSGQVNVKGNSRLSNDRSATTNEFRGLFSCDHGAAEDRVTWDRMIANCSRASAERTNCPPQPKYKFGADLANSARGVSRLNRT